MFDTIFYGGVLGTVIAIGDVPTALGSFHRLVNYIDTKAKCRRLKKLTCKGTLERGRALYYYTAVMRGLESRL
jgi:hypothetical protein